MNQELVQFNNLSKNSGTTLIELLITLTIMLIVFGALVTAFISHNKISRSEQDLLEMQMNLRVATNEISKILSHAGFGCATNFDKEDWEELNIDYCLAPKHAGNSEGINLYPNSVISIYGFRSVAKVKEDVHDSKTVKLKNLKNPYITNYSDNKYTSYISFFPSISGNSYYIVEDINNDAYILNNEVSVQENAKVFMVAPTQIKIENERLYFKNYAYTHSQYWLNYDNFEDIKFEYSVDGNSWSNTVSNYNDVEKIRFWLLVRSSRKHAGHKDTNTYKMGSSIVGPFNDGHYRMLGQGIVHLRNKY